MIYLMLLVNVFIMASGQLFFKRSANFIKDNPNLSFPMNYVSNKWFIAAIALFAISTFVWTQVLTKMPLSVAYPIVSSAYILTVLGAFFFFHEEVSHLGVAGVLFIMIGISLTALNQ